MFHSTQDFPYQAHTRCRKLQTAHSDYTYAGHPCQAQQRPRIQCDSRHSTATSSAETANHTSLLQVLSSFRHTSPLASPFPPHWRRDNCYPGAGQSRPMHCNTPWNTSLRTAPSASWNTRRRAWRTSRPPILISLTWRLPKDQSLMALGKANQDEGTADKSRDKHGRFLPRNRANPKTGGQRS